MSTEDRGKISKSLSVFSWALYDLANQFFALLIVSLYFPRWVSIENGVPEIFYSLAFGVSMLLVAVFAPVLGTIADVKRKHKAFLIFFTLLSIAFTIGLSLRVNIFLALGFFGIANFGCQEAITFYNALMAKIAPRGKAGLVSGLGRMFGYSGAVIAIFLAKPVILTGGYRAAFLFAGIMFFIFALPCMIFVRETGDEKNAGPSRLPEGRAWTDVYGKLKKAFSEIRKIDGFVDFLKASFFSLCAVNTVILFMSVYAWRVFGLDGDQLIDLIAFSTLFAIVGSLLSGYLSDLLGYRRLLMGIFFLWMICILGGALLSLPFLWLVGALLGLSLGSTWVVLRATVVKLVPEEMIGEAFGIFSLINYFSGVVGPVLWGLLLLYLSRLGGMGYRLAFLGLILFFVLGVVFLLKKREVY